MSQRFLAFPVVSAGGTLVGSESAVDLNGDLTMSGGAWTAGAQTISTSGDWTFSGGTFTPGSAPVAAWDASTSTLAQLAVLATHTRTSLATMFDSTGKLTYAPNNLVTYSEQFDNAAR